MNASRVNWRSSGSSSARTMVIIFPSLVSWDSVLMVYLLFVFRMGYGQRCDERRAFAGFTFGGDVTAVVQHDLAGDGQPHSRALVLVAGVQPLENIEDAVEIFFFKADPVVGDGQFEQLFLRRILGGARTNAGINSRGHFDD